MEPQTFIRTWSALWLWMEYLDEHLKDRVVEQCYTYRKGRIDIRFMAESDVLLLSWERSGKQVTITTSKSPSTPRRKVEVLKSLSPLARVRKVSIHSRDRLIKIDFDRNDQLILGAFPGADNVYHYSNGMLQETFLKQVETFLPTDDWISSTTPLPEKIPGGHTTHRQLQAARDAISMDWENAKINFGSQSNDSKQNISDFVLDVLRNVSKSKQNTQVNLQKIAKTVMKRWQGKSAKIKQELEQARRWPELQVKVEALQIGLGMGLKVEGGKLHIPADFSPDQVAYSVDIDQGLSINEAIAATAKKIRKFQGKLTQLESVLQDVDTDIRSLQELQDNPDEQMLKVFLEGHGEALDNSGKQRTERRPFKKYLSPSGFDILVGRSSQDNDTLTFKIANKHDWWFHARQVRGSHVILRTGTQSPTQDDILAAARHAALNSKSKHSGIVVVQYCQRKHLSKPKGSHPGMVLVHQEQSVTIKLD